MTFAPTASALPAEPPLRSSYDVVIVGGAMYGSSVAWWLTRNPDFDGSVLVVERSPTYEFTSTAHTNSCMRQQFSSAINVRVSQFAAEFVKNFRSWMDDDPRVPALALISTGYLYLADTAAFAATLREAQAIQAACGAGTRHMTPDEIAAEYPFYRLDDIVAANHNPVDEGPFDGPTMFDWWRRIARERGAEYVANEVVGMTLNPAGTAVDSVTLKSGEVIACGTVVNASGPRAARTARMAGIEDLPVEPRKRYSYVFAAARPLDRLLPLTIDPSGVHVRSDGANYLAGCAPDEDPAVDPDDFVQDRSLWENKVWLALMDRIPQFDALADCSIPGPAITPSTRSTATRSWGPHTKDRQFHFRERLFRPRPPAISGDGPRHGGMDHLRRVPRSGPESVPVPAYPRGPAVRGTGGDLAYLWR